MSPKSTTAKRSAEPVIKDIRRATRRRLKNGVFHSVVDLQAAINRFIKEHNQQPRPFVWRADPDDIIAAVKRGHQTLESIH